MSFNKVILMGNLTADPELRYTQSNVPVTSFRIAVSRRFKTENQPDADFITIVAWRGTAEFINQYFSKGKGILVCGQVQSRNWTDGEGNKRTSVEVVAEEVSFVEKRTQGEVVNPFNNDAESLAPVNAEFEELIGDDGELPF